MYATYLLGILIYPFKGVDSHILLTTLFKLSKNGSCWNFFFLVDQVLELKPWASCYFTLLMVINLSIYKNELIL
jgi:hypothetical protein